MFYKIRLKAHKRKALFETKMDLLYLNTFKKALSVDENKLRSEMGKLRQKENKNTKEVKRLEELNTLVTESATIKKAYEETKELESDLIDYITLL